MAPVSAPALQNRQVTVDYLRGIAALLVCLCHFSRALPEGWSALMLKYGALGVPVFFVISGFIIPYSLHRAGYNLTQLGRFWAKRIVRLQPTLVVALLITFAISYLSARVKGVPPLFYFGQLPASFVYLDIPQENPVIWTLVVELKYYLFISLSFTGFFSANRGIRWTCFLAAAAACAWLRDVPTLPFLAYFLLGFAACYKVARVGASLESAILGVIALTVVFVNFPIADALAALTTAVLIVISPFRTWKLGAFYGALSYSLYLVHYPVGVKLINLGAPHLSPGLRILLLPLALGVTTAVAWALFRYVEDPSSRWSQRIKLRRPVGVLPVATAPDAQPT